MSSEDTLLSGAGETVLQIGDGNSPEVFADFCAITAVSGLGEAKPLVKVTSMCDLAEVFRGGLPEGAEVTLTANLIQGDAQTRALFESYQADEFVNFRFAILGTSPAEYFQWRATILGWSIDPGEPGSKMSMMFTTKITGAVEWVYV